MALSEVEKTKAYVFTNILKFIGETDHCSAITQIGNKKYRGHKRVTDSKSEDVFHLLALSYSED